MTTLYVIIPVFNRVALTLNCLGSLERNGLKNVEVILVDDGSTDNTSNLVSQQFPWVMIVKGTGTLWWTGSVNLGLKTVLPKANINDAVLLLNNDTELPPDYLMQVRTCLAKYPNSLIGSVISSEHNRNIIRNGGVVVNWLTAKMHNLHEGAQFSTLPPEHIEKVSLLTGRGVAIPIEVFKRVGIYDDKHFSQCGDTELPRRAALAGYSLLVAYKMIVHNATEDERHINHRPSFRLKDIKHYYLDKRSNCNIKYRFWFAMSSNRSKSLCLHFFILDQMRVLLHFIRNLRLAN